MADQKEEEVKKRAHCAGQIHYHIVVPVTYHKALPDEVVTAIIEETATETAERFPIEMEAMGTDKNHIHLLCSAHPKVAPGRIVQMFKSITAREIFRRKPAVKRVLWGGEFGTDGYYGATVGARANWQTVERYVQRQGHPREDLRQLRMF
ncbi:MAG: hypothetical protein OJF52_002156 [Nitrospira sp.]|jgi:putative transposase|nr:MAG: hypothetical protein OJF52_002156 [Nitrospira sp.]